ncbi:MAG: aerobic carbon-monoxide dehydrogenase large subunit [Acidimicrobiia bacterium]|nr:aerobic carbon-monoxide dehydrogenase large subunit [Acidimicrobiia bacterium]
MPGSILGNAVRRLEDPELLRGGASYIDNLDWPGKAYMVLVRSTIAHGLLRHIDADAARRMPGVLAVYTAEDLGLRPHHTFVEVAPVFARPPLATDRVRFVGEAVAAVIAETRRQAVDAADEVIVEIDPLPPVVDPEHAFDDGAPVIVPDHGSNLSFSNVDPLPNDSADEFFADADVVVRGRFENQRIAVVPMEPNSFAAIPDSPEPGRLTVYASTQMPHAMHPMLADVLGRDPATIRVIAPDVGGGFGGKAGLAPEYSVAAAAALKLGRPVTWTETRSEDMVALPHSRAQVQYVELGCRRDGTFTGLRARIVGDSGAYPGIGTMLPGGTRRMSMGNYALPKLSVDIACAITNTTPTGAFRGAGRPEAASMVERIVDQAAIELGIDPIDLRRKNFIKPDQFPFPTHTEITYDSGDYDLPLRTALERSGYQELRRQQAERRASGRGKLMGIGLSTYVEITAGGSSEDYAAVEVHTDGSATVKAGTSAHGQGHATAFAMIVSDKLGIPVEQINLVQSDTDLVRSGGGTGGSRSLQIGGSAVFSAAGAVLDKARSLAGQLLEASPEDIVVHDDGRLGVAGVPAKALAWAQLAAAAAEAPDTVDHSDGTEGLAAQLDWTQSDATFPYACHVAVVEVDADTGNVQLIRHDAVDDCGRVINPLLVAGQQHGGVASGAAQALYEQVIYDEDGNPRTATLADYLMPSAAELPSFEVYSTETPTPLNPLGAKGIGEAGTIGATPAVQNAVIDALAHLGVRHLDMPAAPERVWRAIEDARAGRLPDPWREPPAIFDRLRAGQIGESADSSAADGI